MKYSENTVPKTKRELRDTIVFTFAHAPDLKFPDWCGLDFDGAFQRLFRGIENLRNKLGAEKADQLIDMLAQAKAHYEAGEQKKGTPLMQDIDMVIINRRPFAYPKELYRWPIDPSLPEISNADLIADKD